MNLAQNMTGNLPSDPFFGSLPPFSGFVNSSLPPGLGGQGICSSAFHPPNPVCTETIPGNTHVQTANNSVAQHQPLPAVSSQPRPGLNHNLGSHSSQDVVPYTNNTQSTSQHVEMSGSGGLNNTFDSGTSTFLEELASMFPGESSIFGQQNSTSMICQQTMYFGQQTSFIRQQTAVVQQQVPQNAGYNNQTLPSNGLESQVNSLLPQSQLQQQRLPSMMNANMSSIGNPPSYESHQHNAAQAHMASLAHGPQFSGSNFQPRVPNLPHYSVPPSNHNSISHNQMFMSTNEMNMSNNEISMSNGAQSFTNKQFKFCQTDFSKINEAFNRNVGALNSCHPGSYGLDHINTQNSPRAPNQQFPLLDNTLPNLSSIGCHAPGSTINDHTKPSSHPSNQPIYPNMINPELCQNVPLRMPHPHDMPAQLLGVSNMPTRPSNPPNLPPRFPAPQSIIHSRNQVPKSQFVRNAKIQNIPRNHRTGASGQSGAGKALVEHDKLSVIKKTLGKDRSQIHSSQKGHRKPRNPQPIIIQPHSMASAQREASMLHIVTPSTHIKQENQQSQNFIPTSSQNVIVIEPKKKHKADLTNKHSKRDKGKKSPTSKKIQNSQDVADLVKGLLEKNNMKMKEKSPVSVVNPNQDVASLVKGLLAKNNIPVSEENLMSPNSEKKTKNKKSPKSNSVSEEMAYKPPKCSTEQDIKGPSGRPKGFKTTSLNKQHKGDSLLNPELPASNPLNIVKDVVCTAGSEKQVIHTSMGHLTDSKQTQGMQNQISCSKINSHHQVKMSTAKESLKQNHIFSKQPNHNTGGNTEVTACVKKLNSPVSMSSRSFKKEPLDEFSSVHTFKKRLSKDSNHLNIHGQDLLKPNFPLKTDSKFSCKIPRSSNPAAPVKVHQSLVQNAMPLNGHRSPRTVQHPYTHNLSPIACQTLPIALPRHEINLSQASMLPQTAMLPNGLRQRNNATCPLSNSLSQDTFAPNDVRSSLPMPNSPKNLRPSHEKLPPLVPRPLQDTGLPNIPKLQQDTMPTLVPRPSHDVRLPYDSLHPYDVLSRNDLRPNDSMLAPGSRPLPNTILPSDGRLIHQNDCHTSTAVMTRVQPPSIAKESSQFVLNSPSTKCRSSPSAVLLNECNSFKNTMQSNDFRSIEDSKESSHNKISQDTMSTKCGRPTQNAMSPNECRPASDMLTPPGSQRQGRDAKPSSDWDQLRDTSRLGAVPSTHKVHDKSTLSNKREPLTELSPLCGIDGMEGTMPTNGVQYSQESNIATSSEIYNADSSNKKTNKSVQSDIPSHDSLLPIIKKKLHEESETSNKGNPLNDVLRPSIGEFPHETMMPPWPHLDLYQAQEPTPANIPSQYSMRPPMSHGPFPELYGPPPSLPFLPKVTDPMPIHNQMNFSLPPFQHFTSAQADTLPSSWEAQIAKKTLEQLPSFGKLLSPQPINSAIQGTEQLDNKILPSTKKCDKEPIADPFSSGENILANIDKGIHQRRSENLPGLSEQQSIMSSLQRLENLVQGETSKSPSSAKQASCKLKSQVVNSSSSASNILKIPTSTTSKGQSPEFVLMPEIDIPCLETCKKPGKPKTTKSTKKAPKKRKTIKKQKYPEINPASIEKTRRARVVLERLNLMLSENSSINLIDYPEFRHFVLAPVPNINPFKRKRGRPKTQNKEISSKKRKVDPVINDSTTIFNLDTKNTEDEEEVELSNKTKDNDYVPSEEGTDVEDYSFLMSSSESDLDIDTDFRCNLSPSRRTRQSSPLNDDHPKKIGKKKKTKLVPGKLRIKIFRSDSSDENEG